MKKILLKKKAQVIEEKPLDIVYVPAMLMEPDVTYINPMGTMLLKIKKILPYDGPDKGFFKMQSTRVECLGTSHFGDTVSVTFQGTSPVMQLIPEVEKRIMHSHGVYTSRIASTARVAKAARPPKVDADGKEVVRTPRGVVDPVTGCSAGSQGHVLGLIMIKNKCSPVNRGKCIAEMTTCLEKDFGVEPNKSKSLASSWYSTNWIRKPAYYQKSW